MQWRGEATSNLRMSSYLAPDLPDINWDFRGYNHDSRISGLEYNARIDTLARKKYVQDHKGWKSGSAK